MIIHLDGIRRAADQNFRRGARFIEDGYVRCKKHSISLVRMFRRHLEEVYIRMGLW